MLELPIIASIEGNTTLCPTEQTTWEVNSPNLTYTYLWEEYINTNWVVIGNGSTVTLVHSGTTSTRSIRLRVINPSTNCERIISRSLTQYASPSINIARSYIDADLGELVDFGITSTQTNQYYSWSGPNGFSSTLMNPSINVTTASYGEYILTVRVGTCELKYRFLINKENNFATLKTSLSTNYYYTNLEGKVYFKFDEKYGFGQSGILDTRIYNYDYQEVGSYSLVKEYGYNWYSLDLSSFGIEGDYYVVEVKDEFARPFMLRVKYATNQDKLHLRGSQITCIASSEQIIGLPLEASVSTAYKPYKIEWYVSTDIRSIQNLEYLSEEQRELLLFDVQTNLEVDYASTVFFTQQPYLNEPNIYAPSEGIYYVRARITNYCGDQVYNEETLVIEINLDPACRVIETDLAKEKHRFEFFFRLGNLFTPNKSTTTPAR